MATIDGIGLAEPSTITKSLAAVPVTRNSSVTYQEVMVLGSPNSTTLLALAEVTGSAPASTTVGLVTRPIGPLVVAQSTAGDLNVTVANFSTTVAVSSIAGPVTIRSSAANALVSVYQSTASDLNVTATPVAGSTWRTQPGSTLWASSAGFHFNSSGDLKVEASFTGSTTVTVARTVGNSSAADYMPVRIVDSSGTGFLTPGNEYADGSTYSTKTGPAITFDNSSNQTMRMVSLTTPFPVQVTDSSNAAVKPGDSANNALRVNVVAGSAASTTVNVSSLAGAVITRSSAANMLVSVYQSTAADLNVTVANFSTTVAVSSLGGAVIMRSSAANATVSIGDSSGVGVVGSTARLAAGVNALAVREVYPSLLSTRVVITSSNSTALYTLVSSAANVGHKVFAYSLTSTETSPSTIVFFSSNAGDKWAVSFGSGSSGVVGANLSVAPPAWLFQSAANEALRCLIEKGASTQCIVTLSIAYFSEA